MLMDWPEDWALAEARRRAGLAADSQETSQCLLALAHMIEKHEQPPVDPAIEWARDLIADAVAYGAGIGMEPERKRPSDFRSGDCDAGDLIARAVEGYRKHKEAGK